MSTSRNKDWTRGDSLVYNKLYYHNCGYTLSMILIILCLQCYRPGVWPMFRNCYMLCCICIGAKKHACCVSVVYSWLYWQIRAWKYDNVFLLYSKNKTSNYCIVACKFIHIISFTQKSVLKRRGIMNIFNL